MRNVLAIAEKELRSYFASPMAYVIIGFFLLPFGVFFYLYLTMFVRNGMAMIGNGEAWFDDKGLATLNVPLASEVPAR